MSKKSKQPRTSGEKNEQPQHITDIVLRYLSQRREPTNTKAIAETLGKVGKEGRQETFNALEQLRDAGKVTQISKHRWVQKETVQEHRGRVVGHVDGHGYVLTDLTKEKVFLRAHDMKDALHNDIVQVSITGKDRRNKLIGKITQVLERGNVVIVGRFFNESGVNFVVPDDQRISQDVFLLPEHTMGAESGQVVSVKITKYPTKNFQPVGEVTEVLGDYLSAGMEIEIAIRKHQLPHQWPSDVDQAIKKFGKEVDPKQIDGRKDLRNLPLVTIDGEDARDFDDAVYCEPTKTGGARLIVAIADVSSYVTEDSALDREAWQRGTSVYFPDNVIPMLPEVLSNGLCSLKPNVDRLCFVCDMQIAADGAILEYDFYQAVMQSHARLTYTQVAALLEGKLEQSNIPEGLHQSVFNLESIASLMGKRRRKFGTVEFEIPEPVIIFDEQRKIEKVIARSRNDAHRLIEECMLAANICASLMLDDSNVTGVYRVHDSPDEDRIADARVFLRQFKLLMGGGDQPDAKHFSEVINQVKDPLTAKIVQTALLRSLKQARYDIENSGHFALNFDSYAHFTSPIRRYSDLMVHRQIRRLIANPNAKDDDQAAQSISQSAEQASMTERRAEAATREAVQWLKCEFMSHKIGQTLSGIVATVTEFGLFVELEEFYIDGLVHITSLGQDYYVYDAERRQLVGQQSGQTYSTGQRLDVQVNRVDMEQGRIDFSLAGVKNDKFTRRPTKKFSKNFDNKAGRDTFQGKQSNGKNTGSKSVGGKKKSARKNSGKKSAKGSFGSKKQLKKKPNSKNSSGKKSNPRKPKHK